jgi:PAS domain S-box-containing protein
VAKPADGNQAVDPEKRVVQLEQELEETRRELEAARTEARKGAFFRGIVESSTDVVLVADALGHVTYASPVYEAMTGRAPAEYMGTHITSQTHPDLREQAESLMAKLVAGPPNSVESYEGRHRTKGGNWIHTESVGRNLLHDPAVRGVVVVGRDVSRRKQAEIALGDSERMFRALFEDTSLAVTVRDVRTQLFLDCNTAALRLYGFETREQLYGSTPDRLAPPTQPDGRASVEVLRTYVEQAQHDGIARMEWMARRRNGETFPADVRTTVIALGDGRRVMQTLIEDVTERRQSVQALEDRARRDDLVSRVSRQFVQAGVDVALPFALQALGTFLGADRVRLRCFLDGGAALVTLREWRAQGVPTHPYPRDDGSAPIVRHVLKRLQQSGYIAVDDVEALPLPILEMQQAARPTATRALLYLPVANQGILIGWLIVEHVDKKRHWSADDISTARLVAEIVAMGRARAEAEERTQRRAAHDELLSEVSRRFLNDDPSAATDATVERLGGSLGAESVSLLALDDRAPRLRCTHRWRAHGSAPAFESLEDYPVPPGAFVRVQSTKEDAPPVDSPQRLASWLETLQRDSGKRALFAPVGYGGHVFGLLSVRAHDGRVWTEDDAATLRMIGELIAVGRVRRAAEVTLARATEDAIAANLTKSAFLANMSHELRTPLNGVIGMVDLLATTQLDDRQRRYTEIARASASLLLSVISDILDFSKIEAGKLELEEVLVRMNDIVEEVASILALSAEEKGLELTCQSDDALASPFLGDPSRLRQVLVNLVSNAVKFTKHGEVAVRASVVSEPGDAGRVRVEVRDTGVGISKEAQAKLFQPFTQVDASTTRVHGGTGLGLAICRQLIERMRGTIGLESTPGRGSMFWFEVPFERPPQGAEVELERDGRLAGLRVLGVDDNATNRELLRDQLTAAGMLCDTVPHGLDALNMLVEAASTRPYALAVIDHHMPEMDGRELARRVKADPRLAGTRVVMLGSVANPLTGAEQRADGIAGYCTKPIWRKHLLRVLRAALDDSPGEPAPEHGTDPPITDVPRRTAPGVRILLVEDSEINAEVAGEILRSAGYAFDHALDGATAVDAVKSRPYDLVLMDCQLPEVDGYEATRQIRTLERRGELGSRSGSLPVIALTASATKEDLDRCFAAGMDDHISKPVDAWRLLAAIGARLQGGAPRTLRRSTPSPPSIPVANIARAVERLAGDRTLFGRIAALFADGAPAVREKLRSAVEARDARELAFATHRLKGQASTFGGDALVAATETLGEAATGGNWAAAEAAYLAVERELDRLLRALAAADEVRAT